MPARMWDDTKAIHPQAPNISAGFKSQLSNNNFLINIINEAKIWMQLISQSTQIHVRPSSVDYT